VRATGDQADPSAELTRADPPSRPSPPYHVHSGWSDARGGGGAAPLLAKLDLSGYLFMLSWPTLAALGPNPNSHPNPDPNPNPDPKPNPNPNPNTNLNPSPSPNPNQAASSRSSRSSPSRDSTSTVSTSAARHSRRAR